MAIGTARNASARPEGLITRGKTARNRLRGVDRFMAAYDPALLSRSDGSFAGAVYVDLGYGAEAHTTLESAARLREAAPDMPVVGVEIDPERVAAAKPFADPLTDFRLGGFNLPMRGGSEEVREAVRLVRAFNVLRQYPEPAVEAAYDTVMASVLPGGLMFEGTSDPFGRVWTANVVRRVESAPGERCWRVEALVFGTNFRCGFDPDVFRARLPKNLIHRCMPGEPIGDFCAGWRRAADAVRSMSVFGPRQWFVAAAQSLAAEGCDLAPRPGWLRRGWLVWRSPATGSLAGG